jgi:hypothetical protein
VRQFVGTGERWKVNVFLGITLGAALGFHFLLTTSFLQRGVTLRTVAWPYLFWTLCYQVGLRALGEELLFRGVIFSLFFDEARWSFGRGMLMIVLLDLIAYASLASRSHDLRLGIFILAYRAVLGFLNVFLRAQQNSLIPGWVGNVVFGLAIAVVMRG